MGISWGLMASLWTGPTLISCLSILRWHSIASGSTVDQHSLPAPIDIEIAHIQWSQPAGMGIIIPVGRVLFFVVYCWATASAWVGVMGCGCASTDWGACPPFALGPPFLFNSFWHWWVWSIRHLNSSLRGCWHLHQKCPVSLQLWQCPFLLSALSASCMVAL